MSNELSPLLEGTRRNRKNWEGLSKSRREKKVSEERPEFPEKDKNESEQNNNDT